MHNIHTQSELDLGPLFVILTREASTITILIIVYSLSWQVNID